MQNPPNRRTALGAALALCLSGRAGAQSGYPDKPLRIIVPQPPGGGFDFVTRVLAERLGRQLGQSVVVENRPGSGTLVGTDLAGVELTHVPYRGAQPAYQDLIGGRVDLFFDLSSTARVQVDAGTVKPIAVSGNSRLANHPDLPTITETGVATLALESWFGLFAPARTPAAIQERLRSELARVIASPEVVEIFRKAGGTPLNLSAAETRALVKSDIERWSRLVRELDIKPE